MAVAVTSAEEYVRSRVRVEDRGHGTPCWIWVRKANPKTGYCQVGWRLSPETLAHRLSYVTLVGPIPDGLDLDHLCRVRACVNPAHLEPVTRRENLMRADTFQARNAAKTHCDRGHPFDEWNTIVRTRKGGGRACRACKVENDRKSALRRRYGARPEDFPEEGA